MVSAEYWIEKLQLIEHPEGGYYKETYRSDHTISNDLGAKYSGERSFSTAIYYLLKSDQISTFHKLQSDEIMHFYYGVTFTLYEIEPSGNLIETNLGTDIEKEEI